MLPLDHVSAARHVTPAKEGWRWVEGVHVSHFKELLLRIYIYIVVQIVQPLLRR